jgi:DNA invertase Pin-like site-specific DNA recombinase
MTSAKKLLRCAIYTRKSTEHNLDLEFNSLDAQREACEAYIKSQAHEGWRLIRDHYDDGGLSGASLDRPALQTLLSDLQAGKIDVVVVYKVDRLTRSLTDFAKLVELFDRHGVSFVSITQSFNTTSSMGRLTLNVLLSFAQFEREVIGERVRDKIAASKRKGIWVGGPVPLGYVSVNKKLAVVPEEVETVRVIFRQYLKLGSVGALVEDLDRRGIRTKRRALSSGRTVGGGRFGMGALAHLLGNRFYIGEVVYRGEIHLGDHEPILDRTLFEAVQAKLAANTVARKVRLRGSPALLTGRIFDECGNRMTPSHATKRGVRYRYYVSQAVLQRKGRKDGYVARVSAPDVETTILRALQKHFAGTSALREDGADEREVIARYVERVIVKTDAIEVVLDQSHASKELGNCDSAGRNSADDSRQAIVLKLPRLVQNFTAVKGITRAPSERSTLKTETRESLLIAIANARAWIDDIVDGHAESFGEIAKRKGRVERHIRLLAPLAFVSPRCVQAFIDRTARGELTVTGLARILPDSWAAQHHLLGVLDT